VLLFRKPTHFRLRALVRVLEFVTVEDILSSIEVEAGKHTRDLAQLRVHSIFPASVLGRRSIAKAVLASTVATDRRSQSSHLRVRGRSPW
jgi:hypothetical protein